MGSKFSKLNCSGRRSKEESYHPTEKGDDKKIENGKRTENVHKPHRHVKMSTEKYVAKVFQTTERSSEASSDLKPKPYDFAKRGSQSAINSPGEIGSKSTSPDETSPKSVINRPDADTNTFPPLTNDSTLDEDCIPSLNSDQTLSPLDANNKDESTKSDKKIFVKEKTKSIPIYNDDSSESESLDDDDDDDDDDVGGGGLSFGYVGNLVIGTGKIIDRSTRIVPRKNPKAKSNKKPSTKDNKKNSRKSQVNAKRVDNLGIGTVMILDEKTIQPEKVREKNVPVSSKPVEEKKQPIPVYALGKLMSLKSAIGMIYGFGQTGTAFRVGADKIMTAWHVVRGILDEGNNSKGPNFHRLGNHGVFVDFDYETKYQPDHFSRFPLEPQVLYYNEKLDIAVLQIKENPYGTTFPKPLENFDNFTRQIHEKNSIFLIGHTGAGEKSLDHVLKYWDPLGHRIKELYEWCEEEFELKHGFGYTGIGDETRLHFQCMFRHGASGCPGFIVPPGGEASVVTILLRGFPDFYYFDNFTDEERERVPTEKLIQQGSNIDAIRKDMQNRNVDLYQEIFNYREFISRSEKNQCIDTPSEEKVLNFPQNMDPKNTEPVDSKDLVTISASACSEQNFQDNENMVILASGGDKTHPVKKDCDPSQDIKGGDEEKSTTNDAQFQAPPAVGQQTEDEKPQDHEKCSTKEELETGIDYNNAETTHANSSPAAAPDFTDTNQDRNMYEREKKVW